MRKTFATCTARVLLGLDSMRWCNLTSGIPGTLDRGLTHLTELYIAIIELRAALHFYYLPSLISRDKVIEKYRALLQNCLAAEDAAAQYLRIKSEFVRKHYIY